MLVSQNAELLDITIPNLLKFCKWILIVMDNETEEVRQKVYEYQKKFYDKVWVRQSSIPPRVFTRHEQELNYRRRWKSIKGLVRDEIFVNLRRILDLRQESYDKIDILLFQDSDEIFTDYLPELLERFWQSDKKAISMLPVDAIGDLKTIKPSDKGHHVFIMKYSRELAGMPRRFFALYHPLSGSDLMFAEYYSVHLACLTKESREWRAKNWKRNNLEGAELWYLDKSVEEMSPEEIRNTFKRKPDEKLP